MQKLSSDAASSQSEMPFALVQGDSEPESGYSQRMVRRGVSMGVGVSLSLERYREPERKPAVTLRA